MISDKEFFERISEIELRSIEMMKFSLEHYVAPGKQFPFHLSKDGNQTMYELIKEASEGLESPVFLDPCCLDGFSSIIAARAGCRSYGEDIEEIFKRIADRNIDDAVKAGLLDSRQDINVAVNDMFKVNDYNKNLGISFDEVDIFYINALPEQNRRFMNLFSFKAKQNARIITFERQPTIGGIEEIYFKAQKGINLREDDMLYGHCIYQKV